MNVATATRNDNNRVLFAALLATTIMLFTAFAAAYLERRANDDWSKVALPSLLWINTAVLAASSVTVEVARRRRSRTWLWATLGLGLLFLFMQLFAWQQLRADGVFLPSSAHASFIYILTGLHGVHLSAALIALFASARRPHILSLCAAFWHFMGVVWVYVLIVLVVL